MRSRSPDLPAAPEFSIEEINSFLAEGWRFVERDTRRLGRVAFLDPVKHRESPFLDADAVYIHVATAARDGSELHRRALLRVRQVCPEEWQDAIKALEGAGIDPDLVLEPKAEAETFLGPG